MAVVNIAIVASSVIGAAASKDASRKAGNASRHAVDASERAAGRQADLAERQYQDYLDTIQPRQFAEMDRAIAASRTTEERASKQFDFEYGNSQKYADRYWGVQAPLEDGLIEEAKVSGSEAEQGRQAGLALADVTQRYSAMRGQVQRESDRRGVNPNSGAAMAMARQAAQAEALAGAGAATQARGRERQVGFARRAEVAALGRGLPGFSSNSSSLAGGFNVTGVNAGGAGLGAVGASSGISNGAYGTGSNLWGASGASARGGFGASNDALRTAYGSPMQTAFGNIAGGLAGYGFSNFGRGGGGNSFAAYDTTGYGINPSAGPNGTRGGT